MRVFALALALASCHTLKPVIAPSPITDRVVTVPVVSRCATEPPPAFVRVPAPSVCAGNHLCFAPADALHLVENVERLREWSARIWIACRPE